MTTTYGVISDMHGFDIRLLPATIDLLKNLEVNSLVLEGDVCGERSGHNPRDYFATVLNIAGESGLETFVLPGGHDTVDIWEPAMDHFTKKYSNLICAIHNPKVENDDHHLVFLPGSDISPAHSAYRGYSITDRDATGFYDTVIDNKKMTFWSTNMNDLKKLVTDPDKTILFSHIPRRFNNASLENAVDLAEFGVVQKDFYMDIIRYSDGTEQVKISPNKNKKIIFKPFASVLNHIKDDPYLKDTILPVDLASYIATNCDPKGEYIDLKKENRGNEQLRLLLKELNIKKHITGHFHESAGRATDNDGNSVNSDTFVPELFYNASCMDRLMVGMVSVNGINVAYENINLREYFKPDVAPSNQKK